MSPVVRLSGTASKPTPHVGPPAPPGGAQAKLTASGKKKPQRKRIAGAKKIVDKDLPNFSRQLAAMLSAGMPIVASLETLQEQTDNPNFKPVIAKIRANIENGTSFSEALKPFPTVFSELYVNMVRGGETGGQLAETISRVAGFLEGSAKLKRKVKSAMTYPVIVLCIAILIAVGLILFIVPVFAGMFAEFGRDLPAPTQFLVDTSDFMKARGLYILAGIIGFVIIFKKWKATKSGAFTLDTLYLRAPVFGILIQKLAAARFASTFAQLVHSGVPILSALEISAGATGNKAVGKVILDARIAVEKGDPLSSGLIGQSALPPMLVRMLAAGEKTGKIDEMMNNVGDFYNDEVETMLAGLTSMLEPLLMVFLGIIVGGIVICMFLPIFKMGEVVSG